jgi:hypothetical protein
MLVSISSIVAIAAACSLASAPFSVGIELPTQTPPAPAVAAALKSLGIDYVNYYVKTYEGIPDGQAVEVNRAMLDLVKELGLDFSISCFTVDPPEQAVHDAKALAGSTPALRFEGIVFDELEHCRLLNMQSPMPLADPGAFDTFQGAYDVTLAAYRRLYSKYAALGAQVTATHVWPVLLHVAARAGFVPCPKICKEFYSPVSLAMGMGAALEYGTPLWVDCDMWFWDLVPGHPAEEVLSNLLLAYWLGADRVYLEGAGHNLTEPGKQGTPFSLMSQITPDLYQLTAHGEMLKRFIADYLPAHPREWTFREATPDIAIIRFPDTDHGQYYTEWKAHLYGSPNLPSTPDTRAWFQIWNLLTFGKTGLDGLSFFKTHASGAGYERPVERGVVQSLDSRPVQAASHRFFVPLNGAVVFDHLVGYERLRGIPLLFLTGVDVSEDTAGALRRCASEGAKLIAWGNLAPKLGFEGYRGGVMRIGQGEGVVLITDDFMNPKVWTEIRGLVGHPDEIRYRFGSHEAVLRRVTDNEVAVEVLNTP